MGKATNVNDTSIEQEAAENFARFMYNQFEYLEPWAGSHVNEFLVPKSDFGGVCAETSDVPYEYYRMTPEEYMAETGETLEQPATNWPSTYDNTYGDVTAWCLDFGGFISDSTEHDAPWLRYRRASGTFSDQAMLSYEQPAPEDAPWAQRLHDDWRTAVENRLREVDDVRDEIVFMTDTLLSAAEDYMNIDLENSTGLALTDMDANDGLLRDKL